MRPSDILLTDAQVLVLKTFFFPDLERVFFVPANSLFLRGFYVSVLHACATYSFTFGYVFKRGLPRV
jgi:hypothetical protein